MKIAVQGLGRMGLQLARKLAENGHQVVVHNRSPEPVKQAVGYGAVGADSKQAVLQAFAGDRVCIWIMLPAAIVDSQVDDWLTLLPKDSIIIDGGNSDFRRTKQLNAKVTAKGHQLIDVGTSGGIWGYQNGFSMMVGTDDANAFQYLEPALQTLAAPGGAYHHFGPSGSGHYVKMVHNAIEYGMMESLAEGYRMLHEGLYAELDVAAAGDVWQHRSVITSWLNELCRDILRDNPTLDGIEGQVAESGEARWTLEIAKDKAIPLPAIKAAFDVRVASQHGATSFTTQLLAAMRHAFGGHSLNEEKH